MLLQLIMSSSTVLSIGGETWEQPLLQGLKQGSAYSAELFARVLDFYLSPLFHTWQALFPTWIKDKRGVSLHAIVYADDMVLLASSREHLVDMIYQVKHTLASIGLRLALEKCRFLCSPGLDSAPLVVPGARQEEHIQHQLSFLFLGVLVGFGLSCGTTLFPGDSRGPLAPSGATLPSYVEGPPLLLKGCISLRPLLATSGGG